jgi:hypothetical protein
VKFRARKSTDFLYIHLKNTGGLSVPELRRAARKVGKLDVDYHYVVQENGVVEQGREQYVVAGYEFENSENSIYVLVDTGDDDRLSDAQKVALQDLMDSIYATYPNVKTIME